MPNYQFRSGQSMSAIALRRQELMEHQAEIRERVSFGKQELDAMELALKATQEEQKIKTQIVTHRQAALATQEVSRIDPEKDPDWRQKYAEIMSDFPYAKDDKFLNENFRSMSGVYQATLNARLKSQDETQRAKIKQSEDDHSADLKVATSGEIEKQKRTTHDYEQTSNMLHAAAQKGVDLSPFVKEDEDGNVTHDWAGIAGASAKAKGAVPPVGVIERHAKLLGEQARHEASKSSLETEKQQLLSKNPKAIFPYEATLQDAVSKLAGAQTERASLEAAYQGLGAAPKPANIDAVAGDMISAETQRQQKQPAPQPQPSATLAATPQAPAAPSATPFPTPPPGAVDYLKQHPEARPFFEKRYGDATPHLGQ